jgi:hypothetical protein
MTVITVNVMNVGQDWDWSFGYECEQERFDMRKVLPII